MTKELTVKKTFDMVNPDSMTGLSKVLKNHILSNKLSVNIKGKDYAMVEAWQFAGGMLGLFPIITEMTDLSNEKEIKWMAKCELQNLKTKEIVGRGFAICSNKETIKKGFDEYAIFSMAQTRAIGKSYRNMLGWVMKLAGVEATPSEEMIKVGETPITASQKEEKEFEGYSECQNCGELISPAAVEYQKKRGAKKIMCKACMLAKK